MIYDLWPKGSFSTAGCKVKLANFQSILNKKQEFYGNKENKTKYHCQFCRVLKPEIEDLQYTKSKVAIRECSLTGTFCRFSSHQQLTQRSSCHPVPSYSFYESNICSDTVVFSWQKSFVNGCMGRRYVWRKEEASGQAGNRECTSRQASTRQGVAAPPSSQADTQVEQFVANSLYSTRGRCRKKIRKKFSL